MSVHVRVTELGEKTFCTRSAIVNRTCGVACNVLYLVDGSVSLTSRRMELFAEPRLDGLRRSLDGG